MSFEWLWIHNRKNWYLQRNNNLYCGITDAKNSDDEFYGENRVLEFLNNHTFENKVITNLLQDVDSFTGDEEQFDDMAIVLLDRHE